MLGTPPGLAGDGPNGHTVIYTAPEIIKAAKKGTATRESPSLDMWSFGIIAFEVLTGASTERRYRLSLMLA